MRCGSSVMVAASGEVWAQAFHGSASADVERCAEDAFRGPFQSDGSGWGVIDLHVGP